MVMCNTPMQILSDPVNPLNRMRKVLFTIFPQCVLKLKI